MISEEILRKEELVRQFLTSQGLDGILLSRFSDFAWFTAGGQDFVNKASLTGVADIIFTLKNKYLLVSKIEQYRIIEEEVANQGFEVVVYDWYKGKDETIKDLTKGKNIASDTGYMGFVDVYDQLKRLRYSLMPEELERYKEIASFTAKCMYETIMEIEPGQTEHQIAAIMAGKLMAEGYQSPVLLVATDDRIFRYRHPLPTAKKLERYAMIAVGAQRWGLTVSMTRLVHFGPLSDELRKKSRAVAAVDAAFIAATVPGANVAEILQEGINAYAAQGYADEWMLHHQGGAAGYESREYLARPDIIEKVMDNQAFAWNPSITGTKSEDTIISSVEGGQCITGIPGWPTIDVTVNGKLIKRPDILIR